MNIRTPTKSLLLVAIMLIAASTGALAAAPTVDTETTDTSQQSDLTDGATQTYNTTTASNLSWSADSENSKVVVEQDGETIYSATPDPYNTASGTSYFNVSLADDGSDYDGLDVDAGASVTLNVTFTNNTESSSPDTTNISYTFENGNLEAFQDISDGAVQTPADGGLFSSLSFWSDNGSEKAKTDSTVGIEGNETETITMSVAGTPMADAMGLAAESTESGDVIWGSATSLEGQYLVVANSEAPDTEWFDDSAAYATYDDDTEMLTYHNVDEWVDADAQDVELSATGNDGLGLTNTASMLMNYEAGSASAYGTAAWNADWSEPTWEDDE